MKGDNIGLLGEKKMGRIVIKNGFWRHNCFVVCLVSSFLRDRRVVVKERHVLFVYFFHIFLATVIFINVNTTCLYFTKKEISLKQN